MNNIEKLKIPHLYNMIIMSYFIDFKRNILYHFALFSYRFSIKYKSTQAIHLCASLL